MTKIKKPGIFKRIWNFFSDFLTYSARRDRDGDLEVTNKNER
jgi:hypothetical protein